MNKQLGKNTHSASVADLSKKKLDNPKLTKSPRNVIKVSNTAGRVRNQDVMEMNERQDSPVPQVAEAPRHSINESESDIVSMNQQFESIYATHDIDMNSEVVKSQDFRSAKPKNKISQI